MELHAANTNTPKSRKAVHVLLAEDNPVNARLAAALLAAHTCTFDLAENGREALRLLETGTYDLVLMDMRMPEMDGLEATRQYRAQGGTTPIVALTANAFDRDRLACMEAGMNDFLAKPITLEDFRGVLARFTHHGPSASAI